MSSLFLTRSTWGSGQKSASRTLPRSRRAARDSLDIPADPLYLQLALDYRECQEGEEMQNSGNDRLLRLLDAVVSSYINLGVPVGSRYLSRNCDIGLRPASIRNLLAELESLGFLTKPHVSAGRVPTEKAYRLYLDRLDPQPLSSRDKKAIRPTLDAAMPINHLLEKLSRLLAGLSNQIGVAVAARSGGGRITRLETLGTVPDKLTVRVTVEPGSQRTVSLVLDSGLTLKEAGREVARVAGMVIGKRLEEAAGVVRGLRLQGARSGVRFDGLRAALEGLLRETGCGVHLSGIGNVVPELRGVNEVKSFLDILESKDAIVDMLLSPSAGLKSSVILGSETGKVSMRGCSIISSTYDIGTMRGALGIIGPVRMPYPRLMAVLEFTSGALSGLFAATGGR
jgi:heat-inducible transcriptional repressor